MKSLAQRLLILCFASLLFASCGGTSDVNYIYDVSLVVFPGTVYSNTNHKLDLGVRFLTSERVCWTTDFIGYAKDSDAVTRQWYWTVRASMKRPTNATNCEVGYDTLSGRLVIPFDSAGTYRVDFPQVDTRGNLYTKHMTYTVN